jgi:hypothetical protein
MNSSTMKVAATAMICCGTLFGTTVSIAQQAQIVNLPTVSTKYTRQHSIEVGDVPNHQIRIFEFQRVYGADGPALSGVHIKDSWTHGISDYADSTGSGSVYATHTMENGDRIYAHGSIVTHGVPNAGGKKTLSTLAVLTITGGTGKFLGIRGVVRTETTADLAAGINQGKGEMEYWMEK